MRKRLFGIFIAGVVYAFSGLAAAQMITNDDLEKKYAPEAPADNKWYQWQQQKDRHQSECASLKQDAAYARKAVHDENDPRHRNERQIEYTRINTNYMNKCVPDNR